MTISIVNEIKIDYKDGTSMLEDKVIVTPLNEAAKLLGVTPKTLREWDRVGKIEVIKTPGGHRRVPISEIERIDKIIRPYREFVATKKDE